MTLITAIMPTTLSRRKLIPAAIRGFARQTFEDAVLLVGIDDGDEGLINVVIDEAKTNCIRNRVEFHFGKWPSIGAKRNSMCMVANTPWIAFWDDDDWNAPTRLELTAEAITDAPDIVGSTTMLIHEILDERRRTWCYRYNGLDKYLVGGLLAFRRDLWRRNPFDNTGIESTNGEDGWWVLRALKMPGVKYIDLGDPLLYCAFLHKHNTGNTQAPSGDPSWIPFGDDIQLLLGADLAVWEDAHRLMAADSRNVDGDGRWPSSIL